MHFNSSKSHLILLNKFLTNRSLSFAKPLGKPSIRHILKPAFEEFCRVGVGKGEYSSNIYGQP